MRSLVVAVATAGLVLTACGADDDSAEDRAPTTSSVSGRTVLPDPTATVPSFVQQGFGESHTFSDGVIITVESPEIYDVQQDTYGGAIDSQFLRVPVTAVNGTAAPLRLVQIRINATLNGSPETYIVPPDGQASNTSGTALPGQTSGFGMFYRLPAAPSDLVLEIIYGGQAVYFRGTSPG